MLAVAVTGYTSRRYMEGSLRPLESWAAGPEKRSGLVAPQPAKRGVFGKRYRLDREALAQNCFGTGSVATRVPAMLCNGYAKGFRNRNVSCVACRKSVPQ
jgi:hypothetical protein